MRAELLNILISFNNKGEFKQIPFEYNLEYKRSCYLSWAVYNDHINIVKYLLENGADMDNSTYGPLYWAFDRNNFEIIKLLIEKGADLSRHFYLSLSCLRNQIETVKYLIGKGVDIHENGDHPLHNALQGGHFKIVKLLIEKGANIHSGEDLSLKVSCKYGDLDIIRFLLEQKFDISTINFCLSEISSSEIQFDVIKLLVEYGGNINVCTETDKTRLIKIITEKKIELKKTLLKMTNMYNDVISVVNEYVNIL